MNTAQARNVSVMVDELAERPATVDAFEMWVARNRPGMSLERKEGGGYESTALQAEWLAFAAGWAFRGMLP